MQLRIVATRPEYMDFLAHRYKDNTWSDPIQAWVMDYMDREQDLGADAISPDLGGSVKVYSSSYDEYHAVRLYLPDWILSLWKRYNDARPLENYTREQALLDAQTF